MSGRHRLPEPQEGLDPPAPPVQFILHRMRSGGRPEQPVGDREKVRAAVVTSDRECSGMKRGGQGTGIVGRLGHLQRTGGLVPAVVQPVTMVERCRELRVESRGAGQVTGIEPSQGVARHLLDRGGGSGIRDTIDYERGFGDKVRAIKAGSDLGRPKR